MQEHESKKEEKEELEQTKEIKVEEVAKTPDVEEKKEKVEQQEKKENRKEKALKKKIEKYSNMTEEELAELGKKKRKLIIRTSIIVGTILLIVFIFSIIFSLININNDKIISGISVNQIELSGLSKEEAKGKLDTIIKEKTSKEIILKYKDYEANINTQLIGVNYNVENMIDEAYNTGRDGNIFSNNYSILFTMLFKKNININVKLNEEELTKAIKDASSKIPGATKEASYYIEDNKLIITKGKKGIAIDEEDTKNKIKNYLNDINNNQNNIELKIVNTEPKAINIDEIYKEVHKEAKNAYYTKDPFQIYPEVNGVDFNVEEAKNLLKEDKEEYVIELQITVPEITIEQIGTEAFPERLSIFTTRYDASNYNRTTNLRLACEKIDGKVLLPGETFSYNQTLGERSIAAGYKEAKVYENGRVVDGLGGGICQISSTLYNAVLMANLEVVERRNHQFVTSYLPAGRDATVVYGLTDFKFKNTRKYPIRLSANVQNGIATIAVFGIKEDEEYTITFNTVTVATLPFSTQYEEDASLAPGEEVVEQGGANGIQTTTYIIKSLNGQVVSTDVLSNDTYTPMQRIVRIGAGQAAPQPETPQPETPSAPTEPEVQPTSAPAENTTSTPQVEAPQAPAENTSEDNGQQANPTEVEN